MTSCLRKKLVMEQTTICTESHVAVTGVGASGTKLLLVADCTEKLTVLSEVNQVTIMWVPGHIGIQQKETTDRLMEEGARTRPISPESFLQLSLSSLIQNNKLGYKKDRDGMESL